MVGAVDDDRRWSDDDLNWWCIDKNEIMKYWIDFEDEGDREVAAGVRLYKEIEVAAVWGVRVCFAFFGPNFLLLYLYLIVKLVKK